MRKKEIKTKAKKHFKKTGKCLERIVPSYDIEDLHNFRTEYKKLRAFLRILSNRNANNKIKIDKKLKRLFNLAGCLRDLQLQFIRVTEQAMGDPERPLQYLKFINQEKQKLQLRLTENISGNIVRDNKKKYERLIPGKLTSPDVKRFIRKKTKDLNLIVEIGIYNDATIHETRKIIKDVFYNVHILHPAGVAPSFCTIWNDTNEIYLRKLLEELGEYHDKAGSIQLLKPGWVNAVNKANRQSLHMLNEKWLEQKDKMKKSIVEKITALYTGGQVLL